MTKQSQSKRYDIIQLGILLTIVVIINIISAYVFKRLDLTAEKRYTLSEATKKMLLKLNDVVYVKVYLDGDFPAGFKRLQNETKEMLDEFRVVAGDNLEYEFVNPSASSDNKEKAEIYQQLAQKGIQPTNLQANTESGKEQQIIFPGAIVTYKGSEMPLILLKSQVGTAPEVMLNNSIKDLEYEISNTIRKLASGSRPSIAFITGHRELDEMYVADITRSLSEYYEVNRVRMNGTLNSLKGYEAIIIAKPDSVFDEKDKFVIDQFIMNGGKSLWLIDEVFASMDSLGKNAETVGVGSPLNIEDQLFKYGVRINMHTVLDISCVPIPIVSGYTGNQPQTKMFPWYFFPLVFQTVKHPIVNNLNAVKMEFANTIDTVGNASIKKTVLLTTSRYTRTMNTPVRINLNMVGQEPEEKQFNKSYLPLAVLLEGQFESVFKNRVPPEIVNDTNIAYKEKGKFSKMIVVADGDIIKNQVNKSNGTIYPLGYDKYTRETYGNKNFLLNCINYLCDESELISLRNREVKLRLLDTQRLKDEKEKWQIINTVIPVLLMILLGIALNVYRKRKYSK